jgi:anthranilate phosphoribosyltransferase
VAEERVVVEGHLGVERDELAVACNDAWIDLEHGRIGVDKRAIERLQKRYGVGSNLDGQAHSKRNLARLIWLQADDWLNHFAKNRAGIVLGDFFNFHAACGAGHKNHFAFGAIDQQPKIQFAFDFQAFFDEQALDDAALRSSLVGDQFHAQHLTGNFGGLIGGARELHPAGLAAATGVDLRLDDANIGTQPLRAFARFFLAERNFALGRGYTVARENRLRLIFVNLHLGFTSLAALRPRGPVFFMAQEQPVLEFSSDVEPRSLLGRRKRSKDASFAGLFQLMNLSYTDRLEAGRTLASAEAEALMEELLSGRLETPEIVRVLTALNARPVRREELTGFARTIRRHAARVFADGEPLPTSMVDTCGTGGDASGTFNISTAAAIVAAAAGARVAKHGNRASSSRTGSADVLEALGVRIDLPFLENGRAIREIGIAFLFAQAAHTAARHAAPARKQIGVRTVFNLLGPLTNPAGAQAQVLGVPTAAVIDVVAETLAELGVERAFVVHGAGGLDEISLAGETMIAEVRGGTVQRYTVTPEEFGVARAPVEALAGGDAAENASIVRRILEGEVGPRRDIVLVNAAAALVAAGVAAEFREGVERASMAIQSGAARETLERLVKFTNSQP